jgi:transcriptional regulator with XRE-family HTH domain
VKQDDVAAVFERFGADEIRKYLRTFRKELKLSQGRLAELAGLGQEAISRFEQGKRNLSPDALTRVQGAINKALAEKQAAIVNAAQETLRWYEDPKALKKYREKYGLTKQALAKLANVKASLLSDIEAGRRPLSKDVREPLWEALGNIYMQTDEFKRKKEEYARKREEEREESRAGRMMSLKDLMSGKPSLGLPVLTPGLFDKLGEIKAQEKQIIIQERQIAALRVQVAAQAEQIAALRDLLDLKTKEVLLRDKIESESTAATEKKETAPKDGDD